MEMDNIWIYTVFMYKIFQWTGKHGGTTPQSTSQAALPAYDRQKSRKPIADPNSQLRLHDTTKADA